MLDARWLVNHSMKRTTRRTTDESRNHKDNDGSTKKDDGPNPILPHRQALEANHPEAFVDVEQVKLAAHALNGLKIVCLPCMWSHPNHPDPCGDTLQLVAHWCRAILKTRNRICIFWDCASLHQKPRTTDREESLFQQSLHGMAKFYAHPQTMCW